MFRIQTRAFREIKSLGKCSYNRKGWPEVNTAKQGNGGDLLTLHGQLGNC
jgi:hypothetical protein